MQCSWLLLAVTSSNFSGRFNLRISPDLHRQAAFRAEKEGISLNTLVEKALHNVL